MEKYLFNISAIHRLMAVKNSVVKVKYIGDNGGNDIHSVSYNDKVVPVKGKYLFETEREAKEEAIRQLETLLSVLREELL